MSQSNIGPEEIDARIKDLNKQITVLSAKLKKMDREEVEQEEADEEEKQDVSKSLISDSNWKLLVGIVGCVFLNYLVSWTNMVMSTLLKGGGGGDEEE